MCSENRQYQASLEPVRQLQKENHRMKQTLLEVRQRLTSFAREVRMYEEYEHRISSFEVADELEELKELCNWE